MSEFNSLERRRVTFDLYLIKKWPLQNPSPQQLAEAGFIYRPRSSHVDNTQCRVCDVDVFDWSEGDDPYEAHLQLSPDCLWLKEHREELLAARKHACRRCPAKFASNTKLHAHIQEHHAKKTAETTSTGTPVSIDTPPTTLPPTIWSLSTIMSIDTPPAPLAKAPPPTLSAIISIDTPPTSCTKSPPTLSAITSIDKPTASSTKRPSLPKAAAQTPLTPPTAPHSTWADIASKAPPTPPPTPPPTWANIASKSPRFMPRKPCLKTIKSHLTIDDLYRMFAPRKQPHQKLITTYFKPLGIDQRKRVPATKMNAPSQLSPTLQTRQIGMRPINNYRMHRFAGPDAEKISFRFASKTASETPEWHRHATPPTWNLIDRRHRQNHTKSMAPYGHRFDSLLS